MEQVYNEERFTLKSLEENDILDLLAFVGEDVTVDNLHEKMYNPEEDVNTTMLEYFKSCGGVYVQDMEIIYVMIHYPDAISEAI